MSQQTMIRRGTFQSLLVQVSFKTPKARESDYPVGVSIPSRSGLLQNVRPQFERTAESCFNPFSFRSPSKRQGPWRGDNENVVSIPSRSGLLQNTECGLTFPGFPVSIPSRSGLLQNPTPRRRIRMGCFNPFSFRSPSKLPEPQTGVLYLGFNPFSFRSPSKRRRCLNA